MARVNRCIDSRTVKDCRSTQLADIARDQIVDIARDQSALEYYMVHRLSLRN
jgi:hypothetical protein